MKTIAIMEQAVNTIIGNKYGTLIVFLVYIAKSILPKNELMDQINPYMTFAASGFVIVVGAFALVGAIETRINRRKWIKNGMKKEEMHIYGIR